MSTRLTKAIALLLGLALTAAACGSDDNEATPATTVVAADDAMEDDAMEDDAMEDDAMEDDAMEDDAMEDGRPVIELSFDGLEPLGDDFDYELWTIVDGGPVSGGTFDIDADGEIEIISQDHLYGHEGSTDVVLSIEPAIDPDPAPAAAKPLGGVIGPDGTFTLSTTHPAAFGTDFAEAAGSYLLATPTNGDGTDELSGIWFLRLPGPEASLDLPVLPDGWVYEGWAVIDGVPVTSGRFTDVAAADGFDGYSGPEAGPDFPGEDFLTNAPDGVTFPTDLSGATIVISVEPADDNAAAPFALKPLVGTVPDAPVDHESYDLGTGPAPFSGSGVQG